VSRYNSTAVNPNKSNPDQMLRMVTGDEVFCKGSSGSTILQSVAVECRKNGEKLIGQLSFIPIIFLVVLYFKIYHSIGHKLFFKFCALEICGALELRSAVRSPIIRHLNCGQRILTYLVVSNLISNCGQENLTY
jgi:hypothetical protein